ncbi:MAG: TIGR04283 family arsenosugar biosynthesis glycosyltransferase, partial [Verrucomicrobiales bacterium]|nr:TIGR04283 family arsenosugar biosynthesis glycosyltransferase [Verrucomicrobiales bacterium]
LGSAVRWHLMLRLNHDAVVHGAASVRMVFISQFFNVLFGGPSGGDIPKTAQYSKWFGVKAADVLAASVLDRLLASTGGLVFAAIAVAIGWATGGFAFLSGVRWERPGPWLWGATAAVAALLVGLVVWARRRPESFLGRSLRALTRSVRRLSTSLRWSSQALGCAVLTAAFFNITQVLCLQAVSAAPVPWFKLLWMYHVVTVVASLPVTVAGAGLREGASMVLLKPFGVGEAQAVAAALLTLSVQLGWALLGMGLYVRERALRGRVGAVTGTGRIAVVVPAWNEAEALPETLRRLRSVPEISEVVVVDGGSTDRTREVAIEGGARCLSSVRGRGQQIRAGIAGTVGEVVWIVHADTWVTPGSGAALLRCLRDPLVVGGGFWKGFRDAPWMMRGSRLRCWLRLWWNGWVLGDQALFARRTALERVGGMPEQPLMEEVELCRRLRRVGRLALAGAAVTTSTRRFRKHGIWRTYWLMWRVARGYRAGVDPKELASRYEKG